MKRLIILFLALSAALISSCSQYRYETVKGDPLKTKIYTLDNGLKVFMSVNKETPRIQTYIAVHVGGKNDPFETTGLAHYFEHLMFKGTEQFGTTDYAAEKPMLDEIEQLFEQYRRTSDPQERESIYHRIDSISYEASKLAIPNEYDKLMSMIGADGTNAWTSHDETVYVEDIPSNQIDNWARIQADRFRHPVLRGFHTELETIYEEKNMSLTQDSRKIWEALDNALFPHHPYGRQTVLGTQEHLKNPSITNVKKYHETYYVPNNIAICVSGDFDPDEMTAAIEKYFGDWEPNPDIPALEYEPEAPITSPIERTVFGLEAEKLAMAWPLPAASDLQSSAVAQIASAILYNGQAGLVDLDVNQQQKVLSLYCGANSQPDYGSFIVMGSPKNGQSLEEVRDIALEEIAKLRDGEFDEELIESTINNFKLTLMRSLEDNASRAQFYVDAFINNIPWEDAAKELERYESVTKEDVVEWARKYLGAENYVVVYKRRGEDKSVIKVAAPKITPIVTNRDNRSEFLAEMQEKAAQVKPIEPRFVNFRKDMKSFSLAEGVDVLYKKNELNGTFDLRYVFNTGSEDDPALRLAFNYIDYLGTAEVSAEDFAKKMYDLACSYSFRVGGNSTTIYINGLTENMEEAVTLVENLLLNAEPDASVLANVKADFLKSRSDSKLNQRSCFNALRNYVAFGSDFVSRTTLSDEAVAGLSSEELLDRVSALFDKSHEILLYSSDSEKTAEERLLACHNIHPELEILEEKHPKMVETEENNVVLVQYDAKQLYYIQLSNDGVRFDKDAAPEIFLYNEYFGGGMNSIVFQEMREARGLAYSAWTTLVEPSDLVNGYSYMAFIATQNDKMQTAVEAFDDIINNMPESEAAFSVAKDRILAQLRTDRVSGIDVLYEYRNCRTLGLREPLSREIFEGVQEMSLEDVAAAQEKWVKGRDYTYAILGDVADLDNEFLKTLGPVKVVSLQDIFGF